MADTIDGLQIEIESDATNATNGLDNLAKSLRSLKSAVSAGNDTAKNLRKISSALKSLGQVDLSFSANLKSVTESVSEIKRVSTSLNKVDFKQFTSNMRSLSTALSPLDGFKTQSYSLINSISNIGSAQAVLSGADFDVFKEKVGQMREALSDLNKEGGSLSAIGKSGISSTINAIAKIPNINKSLNSEEIDKFSASVGRLTEVLKPLATEMESVSRGFSVLPSRIQSAIKANEKLTSSNGIASSSYKSYANSITRTITKMTVLGFAMRRVVDLFSDMFEESNNYIENLNLFTVTMGDATDSAMEYANKVSDVMGIDVSQWIENQGVFMRMATGFGVASDQAELMSKNLTQLAYDMSSFFNADVETAMQKLQSGMSGQIKGLKAWGYNLSVAALQETALSLGIEQSVRTMTEAQRAQLRYITLIQKSNGVMGDMARTLITPANSLRILQAQFVQLKRAIGNIISVFVVKLIPYVQAFVEVITDAARAIAAFFGFELPTIDYSGLELGSDVVDDIDDGLNDATDSAKKLNAQLMGFDELNVLKSNSGDVTGSSIGSSNDLGIPLPEYDFLDEVSDKVSKIKESMELILPVVTAIGTAFLAWKIKNALANDLLRLSSLISKINDTGPVTLLNKGTMATLPQLISGIALAGSLIYIAWKNSEDFREGCKALLKIGKAAFDGIAESVGNLIKKLELPELNGESLTTLASAATMAIGMISTALGAPILGGIAAFAGAAVMSIQAIGDAASKEYRGFEDIGSNISAAIVTGLSIGFATLLVVGNPIVALLAGLAAGAIAFGAAMSTDAVQGIEIFDDTISETTKNKVEPFINKMRELDDTFVNIEFTGIKIDDDVVKDVSAKLAEIKNMISTELDADKLGAVDMLGSLKEYMDTDSYAELLAANESYYAQAKENLTSYESEIKSIMQNAANEKRAITDEEWSEIYRIQDEMQSLGVGALSETAIEYETIMRNLKDNSTRVSLEQASEIIKNAKNTRDETIKSAETQYSKVLLEAQKMRDAGIINDEEYQKIIDAAKEARDSTVAEANEQYDSILNTTKTKLGEAAKYIDTETGDIKTKWKVFTEDLAIWLGETFDNMKQGFNDFKTYFKTGVNSFLKGVGETVDGAINGVISAVEKGLNWCIDALNGLSWTVPDWVPWAGGNTFGFNISKVKLGRVDFFADGGFPVTGDMFIARESGPEMVGRIGSKTSVANNDQIVQGISAGVADANQELISVAYAVATQIVTAIRENGGDVYLDGDKVSAKVTSSQKQNDRMYG